jgi:hypothetical protein
VTETEIILKPIYFERSGITEQAAEELDKLAYVMSQNEDLIIYAKSHTDSRVKMTITWIFLKEELIQQFII